jgi:hypothetical protein
MKWETSADGLCYGVKLLGNDKDTIKKSHRKFEVASEANAENGMLLSGHKNTGQYHDMKIAAKRPFENVR